MFFEIKSGIYAPTQPHIFPTFFGTCGLEITALGRHPLWVVNFVQNIFVPNTKTLYLMKHVSSQKFLIYSPFHGKVFVQLQILTVMALWHLIIISVSIKPIFRLFPNHVCSGALCHHQTFLWHGLISRGFQFCCNIHLFVPTISNPLEMKPLHKNVVDSVLTMAQGVDFPPMFFKEFTLKIVIFKPNIEPSGGQKKSIKPQGRMFGTG